MSRGQRLGDRLAIIEGRDLGGRISLSRRWRLGSELPMCIGRDTGSGVNRNKSWVIGLARQALQQEYQISGASGINRNTYTMSLGSWGMVVGRIKGCPWRVDTIDRLPIKRLSCEMVHVELSAGFESSHCGSKREDE